MNENEIAEYEKLPEEKGKETQARIIIRDKDTHEEISSFIIELVSPNHYHPIEIHQCGVYAARSFGYDYKNRRPQPNYSAEIARYYFDGSVESIAELGTSINGVYNKVFQNDFRIDPEELFVVLVKGFGGEAGYALVFRNLDSKSDAYSATFSELKNRFTFIDGEFDFYDWARDGKYFWGNFSIGADVSAIFRINKLNWTLEIFRAPIGTKGGDILNMEKGYITYYDGSPWTGDADLDKQLEDKWIKEGRQIHFYIYDLFNQKSIRLATIKDPAWQFRAKWLSDTELEYYVPPEPGTRRVYTILSN
ncbi:MAG: hypothetical protein A3A80_00260 [Candidatus Terrybacteria bacterium RIFCSPLOWO2_01_FULL_44_24]|uniref:Uncharacterized protein n=1 Tax=Candidatus Terrybacteria bacterium RIFCSPHIGHO2_01_FULL_43_35 TaxID=1802361 RepID=A0A1G2PCB2_9BACT|nr:MAG: hypothetical protein A2828_01010 [Candidatus Terrybacteria bacterium RIFCSPHIGHO2_01_FULL_43_35]OHA50125.1 MAG: hypothetical protein A3B75_01270 [Candidatus Terrybacteria bacterium RIFCSPHIGHO2_02_FULL_43_14]OHA51948.1 MAG: hypothetical protein A3A80_00260 [Candidatus Terrybacteria bacterium RIFCSPLOWO2_01_FULL_44_24]